MLELLLKPVFHGAERVLDATFSLLAKDDRFQGGVAALTRGQLRLLSTLQTALNRYYALAHLPSRSDIDALAGQLAELGTRLEAIEKLLVDRSTKPVPARVTRRRSRPSPEERG